jgi:hypothetical protein
MISMRNLQTNRNFLVSATCCRISVSLLLIVIFGSLAGLESRGSAQTRVEDIFGRSLQQHGIRLVDWDGYMANPLIKFFVLPPTNAVLPGSVTLGANGGRLYFENPGSVSDHGPLKTISIPTANSRIPVRLSIFPDRDHLNEEYILNLVFTGTDNVKRTNTVPIHVMDLDLQRTNEFSVILNFDRDVTPFFNNSTARAMTQQAADDWAYFIGDMNLNPVPVGAESTYIWFNNYSSGYYFNNTNSYRGYLLYAYGTTNDAHRSGGEGSYSGQVQQSGTTPLNIKRSGGFSAEIYGNYNTLGWLFLTNDNDWQVTGNFQHETNDFYSIAHHEIGHALMFNRAHPGFATAYDQSGFTNAAVTNYFGGPVPIDIYHHLGQSLDPESGQGAFGGEYYGTIPRKRWLITKLDLLCAQAVGYTLRPTAAFAPLAFPSNNLPKGITTIPYSHSLIATGGIPNYFWEVASGALPPGMAFDPYSGVISGSPHTNGIFGFTVRVRDYHENGSALTRDFLLEVIAPAPLKLAIERAGQPDHLKVRIDLTGPLGQQQIIQVSTNLSSWSGIVTNHSGTNLFSVTETNLSQFGQSFYRAMVIP